MKLSTVVCALLISTSTLLAADKNDNIALNDIIITGDKLETSLQDSIGGIQVFNDYDFQNSGNLNTIYDLFDQTSSVNRNGQFSFNIRGINTTGIAGASLGPRTTNVQIDGVSLGLEASRQSSISTWDVAQVEVLKGPQSTTQGRNSLAGALLIKTKDPEFEANGALQASYGTNNTSQFSVFQTGAVNENLALRISADTRHTDGFVNNDSIRGDKNNEQDNRNIRGKALLKFGNEGTALLTVSDSHQDQEGRWQVDEDKNSLENTDSHYYTDAEAHSIEINYPLNRQWTFKTISSFAEEELDNLRDDDNLADRDNDGFADTGASQVDKKSKSFEQEFRFNYTGENLKSVIGLYYSKGDGVERTKISNNFFTNDFGSALFVNGNVKTSEEFSNTAIFLNNDYSITERLTLIAGIRLDKDKRENKSAVAFTRETDLGGLNTLADSVVEGIGIDSSAQNDTTNVIPKLGFKYEVNQNITTGILFSKGYRPGGLSTNPITGEVSTYDKESTDNLELSFKSQWLENRLTVNTSLFYTKWKDQQVSVSGSINPFDKNTVNAGKSTLKGIEVDIKAQINSEINIYSNIGYLQAKFDEFTNGSNDNSGNFIQKTPELTTNIGINYRNSDGYFVGGNITYTGKQYNDTENEIEIGSHTLTNIKIGYETNDWSLYLYSNNLFDKEYLVNETTSGAFEFGDERVTGVNFKYYW